MLKEANEKLVSAVKSKDFKKVSVVEVIDGHRRSIVRFEKAKRGPSITSTVGRTNDACIKWKKVNEASTTLQKIMADKCRLLSKISITDRSTEGSTQKKKLKLSQSM